MKTSGVNISRPAAPQRIFVIFPLSEEKVKEAPNTISDNGVDTFATSVIDLSNIFGIFIPRSTNTMPSTDAIIRGFFAIPQRTFLKFTFPSLKYSIHTTARILYIGTISPIRREVSPTFSSPQRAVTTGRPNIRKFPLNIAWMITPF